MRCLRCGKQKATSDGLCPNCYTLISIEKAKNIIKRPEPMVTSSFRRLALPQPEEKQQPNPVIPKDTKVYQAKPEPKRIIKRRKAIRKEKNLTTRFQLSLFDRLKPNPSKKVYQIVSSYFSKSNIEGGVS